ncbi:S-layer homology domain-containing protein [Paenibacillus sp. MBLB4367]|uniref:S-layer homology domain-containing protein n=1 Tax=Paenibacillus sp. MBLB4367 TaxID=3384767 RepID=UPI003907FD4A
MASKKNVVSFVLAALLLASVPVSAGAEAPPALKLDAAVKYPGDTVKLSGTSPFNEVVVKIVRPDGTVLYIDVVKAEKGAFADAITLPADAMPGPYTVIAGQGGTEQTLSSQSFTVKKKADGGGGGNPGEPGDNGGDDGGTGNPGDSGNSGSGSAGGTNPPADSSLPAVSVNGTSITATIPPSVLSVSEVNEGGKAFTKVAVDQAALSKAFQALKDRSAEGKKDLIVSISAPGNAGTKVELPAESLKAAQAAVPNAIVSIQSGKSAVELPVRSVSIARLEASLNAPASDIRVVVTTQFMQGLFSVKERSAMTAEGIVPLADPVAFAVTAAANGKQASLESFADGAIYKKVTVSSKIDPGNSTVVAVDPITRELRFVPSVFQSTADGGTVALIKHRTNETYMIVSSSPAFQDANGHWAQQSIEHLAAKRIVNGAGLNAFEPEGHVTRAEFAALLVRALGIGDSSKPAVFSDVQADDWFAKAVQAASELGLVDGMPDGTFQPGAQVTREQMAVMIERAMAFADMRPQAEPAELARRFDDAGEIAGWAKESMAMLVSEKLLEGAVADKLAPKATATRAEAVTILERFLRYGKLINP